MFVNNQLLVGGQNECCNWVVFKGDLRRLILEAERE